MKKWMILLLVLCLLAGCAAPAEEPVNVGNAPPPAAAEPAPEEPVRYTVDMVDFADSVEDEDGTALAAYSCRLPELTVRRSGGEAIEAAQTEAEARALAAAAVFNAEFAPWRNTEPMDVMTDMAREERAWYQEEGLEWNGGYFLELDCQAYQTERLVSVAGSHYSYTGGAHPNTILMAWNFDLESGAFLEPEQLAEDGEAFSQAVAEEIVRQIGETAEENGLAPEEMFWSNYQEIAAGWSSYAVSFDESGMTVAYSPYELAAYAAGAQVFQLPYSQIAPYLSQHGRALLGLESLKN